MKEIHIWLKTTTKPQLINPGWSLLVVGEEAG